MSTETVTTPSEHVSTKFSYRSQGIMSFKGQDQLVKTLLRLLGLGVVGLLILMILLLTKESFIAIEEFGLEFITTSYWNPVLEEFGGLAFIYGTLVTSFIAILLSVPISILVALFIQEICPKNIGQVLGLLVEMIAAIPSIVFGLWGLFFLAPVVREHITPFLKSTLGFLPIFQGPSFGIGILTASIILAIMITPTITSLCREIFKVIPLHQKEAALALGATRYEAIKIAILGPSLSGMIGASVLGLGRALGETMAVAMVIGNSPAIVASIFAPGATLASVIANEYAESTSDMHVAALCLIGMVLFVITFIVNFFARAVIWHYSKKVRG